MIINSISDDSDFFNDYINSHSFEQLIGKEKAAEIRRDALISVENIINICHDKNIGIITIFDESFPLYLRETESAPVLLYYIGDINNISLQKTAVAGTRRCSAYGRRVAEDIAAALADNGSAVIGSGTEGIEYIAMNMANNMMAVLLFVVHSA
jgi:Predicted Rossmann fold nucleotide-binding protein involved in DNA uptake